MTRWSLLCIWACSKATQRGPCTSCFSHRHQCRQTREISSDFMSHCLAKHPISLGYEAISLDISLSKFEALDVSNSMAGFQEHLEWREATRGAYLPVHAALILWGWNSKALDITEWITAPHAPLACRNSPAWIKFWPWFDQIDWSASRDDSGVGGDNWYSKW